MHGSVKVQGALRGLFNGKASHNARNCPDFDFQGFICFRSYRPLVELKSFWNKNLTTILQIIYKCHYGNHFDRFLSTSFRSAICVPFRG